MHSWKWRITSTSVLGIEIATGPVASGGRRHSKASRRSSARSSFMIGKFMRCTAAALCCLPAVSIAASDDLKGLERVLAKVRSEPMIFVVCHGWAKRLRARLHRVDRWGGQIR
jgi:hypothetical protein